MCTPLLYQTIFRSISTGSWKDLLLAINFRICQRGLLNMLACFATMLQIWHIMPSSQLFEINLDDKIIYFIIHYRNREYNNLDSVTVPLFAFLHLFWQIVLSGTIVKRAGLSTTPLRTLFKHFKKSQMLWVLIPVPPLLPGAQRDPRPSPGSPRGLLLLPLVKAHSSSDRGARPD